jgi:hypothetical protein
MEIIIIAVLAMALILAVRSIFNLHGEIRDLKIYIQGVQDGVRGGRAFPPPHGKLVD